MAIRLVDRDGVLTSNTNTNSIGEKPYHSHLDSISLGDDDAEIVDVDKDTMKVNFVAKLIS